MTALEIFLSIVLWIIIGLWISYKRNWYQDYKDLNDGDKAGAIVANIVLMPLLLLRTIFFEYLNDDWEKS